jgi:ribose transport system substrate-binding protein
MKKVLAMFVATAMGVSMLSGSVFATEASTEAGTEAEAADSITVDAGDVDLSSLTFAYVPTTMNNPFWTAMMGGIKDEMKKLGMDPEKQLVTVDANSDQAKMNNYVSDLINQKVDAIILAPMDTSGVTEALQACSDAGIPVINVDTPVERTDLVASVIASDNYTAGVLCAKDMMSKLDKGAKVAVMNQASATACEQREAGFKDTAGDYFDIVSTTDTRGDTAKTLTAADDAITADSDLAAFFCINDMGALGCVQAATAANRDDILIYGVDGNPDFMGYVKDGSATASAAQQPSVIGSDAVDAAINSVAGTDVPSQIVVPVTLITQDNIDQFDISDWQ